MFTLPRDYVLSFCFVFKLCFIFMLIMLDSMYQTISIFSGLHPNLDLWNANKLQLRGTTRR